MPPPRNAKRAPAPKHRGKNNTATTAKTATVSGHHPYVVTTHPSSNSPTAPSKSHHTSTRPPPPRLSKAVVMRAQAPPQRAGAAAADNTAAAPIAAATTAALRGFTYLSPETIAASRTGSAPPAKAPASPTAPIPPPRSAQPAPPSATVAAPSPSLSPAESSLARLRALAGPPSLRLSPPTSTATSPVQTPGQYRNEESPLQTQPPPLSSPASPYTPDLVRRLAALTGTPFAQTLGVVRLDRLKRNRKLAAAAPPPLSPDHFAHRVYNDEEAEVPSVPATSLFPPATAAAERQPTEVRGAELENEEEGRTWHPPPTPSTTVPSSLDRLRAARRVAAPVATSPSGNSPPPPPWFLAAAAATPATSPSASTGGAERLSLLRLRASASPEVLSPVPAAPLSTAPAAAATASPVPVGDYMNLERMQVGHGSTTGTAAQPSWTQAPQYTLLAQARDSGHTATTPTPPTAVDAPLEEAVEVARLDAHLQRYRDAATPRPPVESSPSLPRRQVRRSQRHQTASAAKKESAVATLVKGRRSSQQLAASANATAFLTSAERMSRLRSGGAPVPVGEGTSMMPPSWTSSSSSSPFTALASPSLYGMLKSAARDQHGVRAETNEGADTAANVVDAQSSRPSAVPDVRRLPAFSSHRDTREKPLPAAAECFVFDTSSLLDSEPGVLNLLLERAHIGIPFKVLDELDFMHKGGGGGGESSARTSAVSGGVNNNNNGNVPHDREWRRKRAHDLRNWIASCVSKSNSHLLLQRRTEVVEEYDRHTSNNDDRILGYAVYLRRSREKVLFVTEDKFLRIKAAAEIGRAYTYSEIRQMVGMPRVPSAPAAARRVAVYVRRQKK